MRTHTCGDLRETHLGKTVTLCGWVSKRRDHGGVIFIDLRDRYGLTQVVFDPKISGGEKAHEKGHSLRPEFVLQCTGRVRSRPEGMKNSKLPTGAIEVECTELQILSEAKTPPFAIEDEIDVAETVRLKYRYLDLRRSALQKNLLIRHRFLSIVRNHLDANGFVEVETPILYKSTPEGARDFIVPSRLNQGSFYALPQSPQTLKQLLMVSGLDRYYQVARCFRDEDLRADRQPEFSQIDIEASFINEEVFFPIMEEMVAKVWKEVRGITLARPFRRMSYQEAMSRYGSDKPDTRFGLELQDLTSVFSQSQFQVFQAALKQNARGKSGSIRALLVQGKAESFSRKDLDDLTKVAAGYGAKGLLWMKVQAGLELQSPAAKFFSAEEKAALVKQLGLKEGDLILVVADSRNKVVFDALGALRLNIGEKLGLIPAIDSDSVDALWVTDFPLVEYDEKENRYYACHHPFTSPQPEFFDDFIAGKNLENIRAAAYDLVLNGCEIAGGSLRIYRSDIQSAMFKILGLSPEEAKEKFGFFIDALQYGTPPHGGIAFGVDRFAAQLCGVSAIRDVMAFPKTQKGTDLMADAPSAVSKEQLKEVGIEVKLEIPKSVGPSASV